MGKLNIGQLVHFKDDVEGEGRIIGFHYGLAIIEPEDGPTYEDWHPRATTHLHYQGLTVAVDTRRVYPQRERHQC